jgi:hypothetical protein
VAGLPARVGVLWDVGGVQGEPAIIYETRKVAAIALSVAAGGMVAELLNGLLPLSVPIAPAQIRTSCGTCTNDPRPDIPVQIEVMFVISPDKDGVLAANTEYLRLGCAAMVLNWFETNQGVCQGAKIEVVRVSLLGLGMHELTFELDPYTRFIIGGSGGDLSRVAFGTTTVPTRL